jgi:hypothetical protein
VTGSGDSLSPKTSRWDNERRRRSYEGSSITARDGRLTWVPTNEHLADAWSLTIGSATGQATKVVHVYGLIVPAAYSGGIYLDRYAVLDGDGRLLGWFPSGVEGRAIDANEAWYRWTDIERLAESAGLAFIQDQVDAPQEVIGRYPGLYAQAKTAWWLSYLNTVVYVPMGLFVMVLAFHDRPLPGAGPFSWFMSFFVFGFGAMVLGVGVLVYPTIRRRYLRWMKTRHPERFAPQDHYF